MSDLEKLRQTLVEIGITVVDAAPGSRPRHDEASVSRARNEEDYNTYLTLGSGIGYSGFECAFKFNQDGKFVDWGVWE